MGDYYGYGCLSWHGTPVVDYGCRFRSRNWVETGGSLEMRLRSHRIIDEMRPHGPVEIRWSKDLQVTAVKPGWWEWLALPVAHNCDMPAMWKRLEAGASIAGAREGFAAPWDGWLPPFNIRQHVINVTGRRPSAKKRMIRICGRWWLVG